MKKRHETICKCESRPIGYLCLSVSSPAYTTSPNSSFMMWAKSPAVSMPCRAPTNTVLLGKNRSEGEQTKLLSVITHGITCTYVDMRNRGFKRRGTRRGTPSMGCQSIKGHNHTHLHTHSYSMDNLDAIQPTTHISVVGRKPKDPEETPWSTRKPCKLHAHRAEAETDSQPGHVKANMLTVLIISTICLMIYRVFSLTNYQQDSSAAFKNMSYKWIKTK